jgi:hypothetical protein
MRTRNILLYVFLSSRNWRTLNLEVVLSQLHCISILIGIIQFKSYWKRFAKFLTPFIFWICRIIGTSIHHPMHKDKQNNGYLPVRVYPYMKATLSINIHTLWQRIILDRNVAQVSLGMYGPNSMKNSSTLFSNCESLSRYLNRLPSISSSWSLTCPS